MLEARKAGLRLHDISEGLKDVASTGAMSKFKNTILLGKATTLALHIKGHDVIKNFEALEYASAELGISSIELDYVLRELQEIGFIRKYDNRIEIIVPTFIDAYQILGQRWYDLKPSDIELKSVNILSDLENNPLKTSKITDIYDLSDDEKRIIYEVGDAGTYLEQFYTATGEEISFSPALTELHPEKIYNFTQKNPQHDLSTVYSEIRKFQGKPLEQVTNKIVKEAFYSGILLQTEIGVGQNKRQYLFAPVENVSQENRIILDKARAILSCVRCGEYHTEDSTKIFSPYLILKAMKERKKLRSNTSHKNQYGLIITKGIARLGNPLTDKSELNIIDTDENMKAIDLSIEMLGYSNDTVLRTNTDIQLHLFNPSSYSNPTSTRVKFKREINKSKETQKEMIEKISQMNQGIYDAYRR